ncbi:hypothetical protein P3342_006806 [Pyrenophora teres f. teres]|nr:hypothetical protein P3342_006806 [Pyrenophora teres f. teres]
MPSPKSTSDDDINFTYQSLNQSEPSIRLIQILPMLSDNGRIQCAVTHTTISAIYSCLSYRWGDCSPTHTILVDGKPFTIRQNLFDFLMAAHTKAASEDPSVLGPHWIDALCIDQSNVLERNHQVAQMSKIYAGAERVHIWLGKMDDLSFATVLEHRNEMIVSNEQSIRYKPACRYFINCVVRNEYWTRTWIVQEYMLACRLRFWFNTRCIARLPLLNCLRFVCRVEPNYQKDIDDYLKAWDKRGHHHRDLACTLDRFRNMHCYDPRDRIFSLLSLVRGDGQNLQVDYRRSPAELAIEVLREYSGSLTFCVVVLVIQALRLQDTEPASMTPETPPPRLEFLCGDPMDPSWYRNCPDQNKISIHRNRDTGGIQDITYWSNEVSVRELVLPNECIEVAYSGERAGIRISFHLLARLMAGVHVELCDYLHRTYVMRVNEAGCPRIC